MKKCTLLRAGVPGNALLSYRGWKCPYVVVWCWNTPCPCNILCMPGNAHVPLPFFSGLIFSTQPEHLCSYRSCCLPDEIRSERQNGLRPNHLEWCNGTVSVIPKESILAGWICRAGLGLHLIDGLHIIEVPVRIPSVIQIDTEISVVFVIPHCGHFSMAAKVIVQVSHFGHFVAIILDGDYLVNLLAGGLFFLQRAYLLFFMNTHLTEYPIYRC